MLNLKFCNLKGDLREIVPLPEKLYSIFCHMVDDTSYTLRTLNYDIIDRVIHYQNCRKRQTLAATKFRSEINYSTKKMGRQKGSGNARHGTKSAPQLRKGAKAHGPKLEKKYAYDLNKKIRKQALCHAISYHAFRGTLYIIKDTDFVSTKTKEVLDFLKLFPAYPMTSSPDFLLTSNDFSQDNIFFPANDVNHNKRKFPKSLFVGIDKKRQKNTLCAVSNLNAVGINYIPAIGLNVKDIMNSDFLFLFEEALEVIKKKCNYIGNREVIVGEKNENTKTK